MRVLGSGLLLAVVALARTVGGYDVQGACGGRWFDSDFESPPPPMFHDLACD